MDRTLKIALASLTFNIAFATYHLVMGLVTSSWWLLTLGSYYLVLSIVRYVVLRYFCYPHYTAKVVSKVVSRKIAICAKKRLGIRLPSQLKALLFGL